MSNEIRIIKKATCPSLSKRSDLTYELGLNEQSKSIVFRIADNTGSGHFQDTWIPLDAILECLKAAKEPFSLSVFIGLYQGQSINNVGFLGAALLKEGLVTSEKRKYLRQDTKSFLTNINKLAKPAKKTRSKK